MACEQVLLGVNGLKGGGSQSPGLDSCLLNALDQGWAENMIPLTEKLPGRNSPLFPTPHGVLVGDPSTYTYRAPARSLPGIKVGLGA